MKKLINIIAPTLLAIILPLGTYVAHEEYLYASAKAHTVMLITPTGGGGTGFFVNDGKHIITNNHICRDYKKLFVPDGGLVQVIKTYPDVDLCVLKPLFKHVGGLGIANNFYYGEHVRVMGHGFLLPLHQSLGRVESRGKVRLAVAGVSRPEDCPVGTAPELGLFFIYCLKDYDGVFTTVVVHPGNSGSPVIDVFGRVIGVVFASHTGSNFGYIVPLEYVQEVVAGIASE